VLGALAVNNFGLGLIVVGAQWGDEGKGHPRRPTEQMNPAE